MRRGISLMSMHGLLVSSLLALGLLPAGCSSLPTDAPTEFHEAKQALRRAERNDVNEVLPQTLARAANSLDEGLYLLKNTRARSLSVNERSLRQMEAVAKANEARALAAKADALYAQVKAWDARIERYSDDAKTQHDLEALQKRIEAALAARPSPTAKAAGELVRLNLKQPLAFFATNNATVDRRYDTELARVASLLKQDGSLNFKVVGYADPRGRKSYNDKLARQRAAAVARRLVAYGVAGNRVHIESRGAVRPQAALLRDELPLERRAELEVIPAPTQLSQVGAH